jgi:hypothetical protein
MDFNKTDNLIFIILIVTSIGILIGYNINSEYSQLPNFYKQLDDFSNNDKILDTGEHKYYIIEANTPKILKKDWDNTTYTLP